MRALGATVAFSGHSVKIIVFDAFILLNCCTAVGATQRTIAITFFHNHFLSPRRKRVTLFLNDACCCGPDGESLLCRSGELGEFERIGGATDEPSFWQPGDPFFLFMDLGTHDFPPPDYSGFGFFTGSIFIKLCWTVKFNLPSPCGRPSKRG